MAVNAKMYNNILSQFITIDTMIFIIKINISC